MLLSAGAHIFLIRVQTAMLRVCQEAIDHNEDKSRYDV